MDSIQKTKNHVRRWLPIEALVDNPDNPNEMGGRQFDLLVDNIETKGVTEDIEVRQIEEPSSEHPEGVYRIIGGHHRAKACRYLGWAEVPVIINTVDMTDDEEAFQVVRMNAIHGKLSPQKFVNMYQKVSQNRSQEEMADLFGFADEEELRKLIKATEKSLPPELKEKFKEAAKEISTIEDLAKVLNELLYTYGDSLAYGYMIFDFNGKEAIWVRMDKKDREAFFTMSDACRKHSRTMDDMISSLVQLMSLDEHLLKRVLDMTVEQEIKPSGWPTKEDMSG